MTFQIPPVPHPFTLDKSELKTVLEALNSSISMDENLKSSGAAAPRFYKLRDKIQQELET